MAISKSGNTPRSGPSACDPPEQSKDKPGRKKTAAKVSAAAPQKRPVLRITLPAKAAPTEHQTKKPSRNRNE
jgi:hypothetical protein